MSSEAAAVELSIGTISVSFWPIFGIGVLLYTLSVVKNVISLLITIAVVKYRPENLGPAFQAKMILLCVLMTINGVITAFKSSMDQRELEKLLGRQGAFSMDMFIEVTAGFTSFIVLETWKFAHHMDAAVSHEAGKKE